MQCAECGCSISPEKSKGYNYYHCTQYRGKHGAAYMREEDLTEQLAEYKSARDTIKAKLDATDKADDSFTWRSTT